MKVFLVAILFSLTVSFGQNRLYTGFQMGVTNWMGFVPEEKRTPVNGFFLSAEMKWEFHPAFNAGIGALVASEFCTPFGCGYNISNFNQTTFFEIGWVWKKWKIETDMGPFLGIAYKTGPGRTVRDTGTSSSYDHCSTLTCFLDDQEAEEHQKVDLIPGGYVSLVCNIGGLVFGVKQRYFLDNSQILNESGIYVGARVELFQSKRKKNRSTAESPASF